VGRSRFDGAPSTQYQGTPTVITQPTTTTTPTPGAAFRARYLSRPTCDADSPSTCLSAPAAEGYGLVSAPGVGFSNYDTLVRSSALDRTLLSANAFLTGAFPAGTAGAAQATGGAGGSAPAVPVYSVADGEDWRVRAYTKCPAYERRLAGWFGSPEFAAKEEETRAVREGVGAAVPGLNVSLTNWWNGEWRRGLRGWGWLRGFGVNAVLCIYFLD